MVYIVEFRDMQEAALDASLADEESARLRVYLLSS
jgi:hypothetical protein